MNAIKHSCLKYHYAGRVPVVAIGFNVYEDEEWCGTIVYGWGANPHIANIYDMWNGQVLELVRVALNGKQKKTSECLGRSLKLLKKYCPMVDLVVSYADVDENHKGIIYKATNWLYVGKVNEGKKTNFVIKGKNVHQRSIGGKGWKINLEWLKLNVDKNAKQEVTKGKHKFLYALDKDVKKRISDLSKDYASIV